MALIIETREDAKAIDELLRAVDLEVRAHLKTAGLYGIVIGISGPAEDVPLTPDSVEE